MRDIMTIPFITTYKFDLPPFRDIDGVMTSTFYTKKFEYIIEHIEKEPVMGHYFNVTRQRRYKSKKKITIRIGDYSSSFNSPYGYDEVRTIILMLEQLPF